MTEHARKSGAGRSRRPGFGLPIASGLLIAASFPPVGVIFAPFVALVPLALTVHGLGGASHEAARSGLVSGLVAWGVLLFWLPAAVETITVFGPALYVAAVLFLASFTALFAWALSRLQTGRLPFWIAVPVAWTACEWLRAHAGPFAFPWLELGTSLAGTPALAASAEWVGSRGLSFWLALSSGLLTSAWVASPGRPRRALTAGLISVTLIPTLCGISRNAALDLMRVGRVAVFQANVSRELRASAAQSDSTLIRLARLVEEVRFESLDLALWPEATFVTDPREDPVLVAQVSALVDRLGAPVLFGAYLADRVDDGGRVQFNGALLWRPEQGPAGFEYRKHRLVPGVEAVPFVDPEGSGAGGGTRGFGRGQGVEIHRLNNELTLAPLICFESVFSADARGAVDQGANLLVNLTNDVWLGTRRDGRPTVGMQHHAAHAVMRAIETRTGLARAANTGITMFVGPSGKTLSAARPYVSEVRVESMYTMAKPTLFVRHGDVLGTISAIGALALIALSGLGRFKRGSTTH